MHLVLAFILNLLVVIFVLVLIFFSHLKKRIVARLLIPASSFCLNSGGDVPINDV